MKTNDIIATLLGLAAAIANSLIGIDWDYFEWTDHNRMTLILSAVIAASGYFSTLKPVKKPTKKKDCTPKIEE